MSLALALILIILFLIVLFISLRGIMYSRYNNCDCDVESITTTTTTEQQNYEIVGTLRRQFEGSQPFVIDPVDGSKTWLNTKDDMYEDATDKVWRLV